MSRKTISMTDALHEYMIAKSVRESAILRRLREETAAHPEGQMQIAPEQGQLLSFLLQLIDARRVIEIGVFTGYSSLTMALSLPPDGHITACDVSDDYTQIARRYWEEAGVAHKITLHLAPARDTLKQLARDGAPEFDFAFIDADKEGYDSYYEGCLRLLRKGGLIMLDNVFRGGRVADPDHNDAATIAIRTLNDKIAGDDRVDAVMLPVADGITLVRKRP